MAPRWLAAAGACLALGAIAQTLDLRLPAAAKNGVVTAIRTVDLAPRTAPATGGRQPVGSQSDLNPGIPVGAVVALSRDPSGERTWKYGAAGTPEMKPYLAESAQEVVVKMDDGETRSFRPPDPGRFRVGQRVTVREGGITPAGVGN
jgi:hypothetical protein